MNKNLLSQFYSIIPSKIEAKDIMNSIDTPKRPIIDDVKRS